MTIIFTFSLNFQNIFFPKNPNFPSKKYINEIQSIYLQQTFHFFLFEKKRVSQKIPFFQKIPFKGIPFYSYTCIQQPILFFFLPISKKSSFLKNIIFSKKTHFHTFSRNINVFICILRQTCFIMVTEKIQI